MSRDPLRLSEQGSEASEELRGLLQEAKDDMPTHAELRDLALRLGPVFGAVGVAAGIGASGGASAAAGTAAGATTGASLAGGTATGASVAGTTAAAAAKTTAASMLAKIAAGAAVAASVAGGTAVYVSRSQVPPERPMPTSVAAPVASALPPATPKLEVGQPPAQPPEPVVAEAPEAPAVPPVAASVQRAPQARPPLTEAQLLQSAQTALRTNPSRALALTQEHRRRFPNGTLSQEREVIAIEALSRLGRAREASQRAGDFQRAHPGSVHQRKVQGALESK